ncbi:MAG: carboxypeptidase regulatory-like domain-containing protein [Pseudomonadota bacterium]
MSYLKKELKGVYRVLLVFMVTMAAAGFWQSNATATDCIVTPKSLSMSFTSLPQAEVPIDFTAEAVSGCGGSIYYFFTYTPDYGTSSYDAARFWVNMTTGTQTVSFTNTNTVRYSFPTAGYYIVVVDVSPSQSFPPTRNIIGCSVAVQENSGGGSGCSFDATALNITVKNALTGAVIPGATVSVLSQTATTDSSGLAAFMNLPTERDVAVQVSAPDYVAQTTQVRLVCGQTQSQSIALLSSSNSGVISGDVRVILTWGEHPSDLDTHLTGPKTDSSTDRFHVFYSAKNNNGSGAASDTTIPAWLDVDDTSSFGPETATINKISGSFIPGTYRYYIHHYTGSSDIPNSGAAVQLYIGSTLVRSFNPPSASSSQTVTDDWVWSVFELDLSANGTYSITTTGTYSGPYSAYDTTIFRGPADPSSPLSDESSYLPEVYRIFPDLPEKE